MGYKYLGMNMCDSYAHKFAPSYVFLKLGEDRF